MIINDTSVKDVFNKNEIPMLFVCQLQNVKMYIVVKLRYQFLKENKNKIIVQNIYCLESTIFTGDSGTLFDINDIGLPPIILST